MASRAEQLFFEALDYLDRADVRTAELRLREALALAPGNASILTNLAVVCLQQGKHAEARAAAAAAIAAKPGNVEALLVVTACHAHAGQFADALAGYNEILAQEPGLAEVHANRAHALNRLRRHGEAVASCDRAIALQPDFAGAQINRGNALVQLGRYDEARAAYDAALRLAPNLPEAWLGHGNVLLGERRHDEALAAYDRAMALDPDFAAGWLGRANVLAELRRHDEAQAALDRALAIDPGLARAWLARGNLLRSLAHFDRAFAAYDQALALDRRLYEAHQARAEALVDLGRYREAVAAYDGALAVNPDAPYLPGLRLHARMWICDWSGVDAECAGVLAAVRSGAPACEPLVLLGLSSSATDQLACGATYSRELVPPPAATAHAAPSGHERIRIAYVSGDFRDHPVAFLTAGMFEHHDRDRFETFAISLSPFRSGAMHERLKSAFTQFVDVSARSDAEIVALMRDLGIDIAVDLAGYTRGSRPGIFAGRAAPVQVSHLGFPGTMGAPFIDYIIADRIVIPPELRDRYTERVVHLPDTFQVNDAKRHDPAQTPTRADMGLPPTGFVFCVFHSSYKLNPAMFDIWMRLLREIDGSVLWLVADDRALEDNLRREAQARGVAPERLVFAGRLAYADHLARQRLADLFLDALPFNGGTTTSDALWMGLPVLTRPGEAFASRMSASLLAAVGLPELVVQSIEDYEALAMRLARDPGLLRDLKARLVRQRTSHPLFDTARFTRHIEAAYVEMWERHRRGEPPAHFAVEPIG